MGNDYKYLIKEILADSDWSQEELAERLGVSFSSVNAWLNDRAKPRETTLKRIQKLYLAQDIEPSNASIYITLKNVSDDIGVGEELVLEKTPTNEDEEAIMAFCLDAPNIKFSVANSPEDIIKGTQSAGRIFDKISTDKNTLSKARVEFRFRNLAIAKIIS